MKVIMFGSMAFASYAKRSLPVAVITGVLALGACSTSSTGPKMAPVEDRGMSSSSPQRRGWAPGTVAPVPGSENAGKPGYFTVRPGDTVRQIGRETNVAWQDIVRWNNLANPNQIEIGQALRVVAPVGNSNPVNNGAAGSGSAISNTPGNTSTGSRPVASVVVGGGEPTPARAVVQAPLAPAATAPGSTAASGDDAVSWIWPNAGPVLAGFDEVKNKGLAIGGRAGDTVMAAADGVVYYAGPLRGYGNLVILKHNNTYLTAYGHNQTLLVKEDQTVRKGQKIAEMGSSESDRVKLHFEVRRNGKPVDPIRFMPVR
jgi:lipoprotein NlpD